MPRWLQIRYTTLYATDRTAVFADYADKFAYPTAQAPAVACGLIAHKTANHIRSARKSRSAYYAQTETSPPVSKLFGADTGGIKNPPYDSNYTGKSGAVKGKTSGTSSALDSTQLATAPQKKIINRQKNNKEQNIIRKKVLTN